MIFDAHIHQGYGPCDTPKEFLRKAAEAGVAGGNVFSVAPEQGLGSPDGDYRWEARLEAVLSFSSQTPGFLPFFRINPLAPDAFKQILTAVEQGIHGFKIICESYYPKETVPACEAIAETGLPLMFHSGILSGQRDRICGAFGKPIEFECLFAVRGLRFSLAHIGWPWVDEYLGMVAKSYFTRDPEFGNEMFFDLTPGTPGIYREEALRKLYLAGYPVKENTLWGTDLYVNDYEPKIALFNARKDKAIMERITADNKLAQAPFMDSPPDLSDLFRLAAELNIIRFNKKKIC